MSLEAVRGLSVFDLLRVLNEKLGLECSMFQNTPVTSATSLEFEVTTHQLDPS